MIAEYNQKATVQDLCTWAEVPRSSFHYSAHPGPLFSLVWYFYFFNIVMLSL
jgi:hypothetical protein